MEEIREKELMLFCNGVDVATFSKNDVRVLLFGVDVGALLDNIGKEKIKEYFNLTDKE